MSNLVEHAKRELEAAGYFKAEYDDLDVDAQYGLAVANDTIELVETFAKQEHSGFSASIVQQLFNKLAGFKPLTPLTGEDSEWNDVSHYGGGPCWQNKRCSHVFKDADGKAYDIQGIVFEDENGACYTNGESRVYIKFPYMPQTQIVKRSAE